MFYCYYIKSDLGFGMSSIKSESGKIHSIVVDYCYTSYKIQSGKSEICLLVKVNCMASWENVRIREH